MYGGMMHGSAEDASLREVMRSYPTGVTIVAACDAEGVPFGLTVNSFSSVSLDPPLVLVCIGRASSCHDRLVSAPHFAVNILSSQQESLASRFAGDPSDERFDGVKWSLSAAGVPIIDGAVARLECSHHEVLVAGDHSIVLGRVERSVVNVGTALLFHNGSMGSVPE